MQLQTISQYYARIQKKIRDDIESQSEDYVLGVDENDYADFLFKKYSLPTVERDLNRETTIQHNVRRVNVMNDFGDSVQREFPFVTIEYPLKPKANLEITMDLRGSSWSYPLGKERFDSSRCAMILEIDSNPNEVNQSTASLESNNQSRNQDIDLENRTLKTFISNMIGERKRILAERRKGFNELIEKINIHVVEKPMGKSPVIDLGVKKELQILTQPGVKKNKDYFLDKEKALAIVNLIEKVGHGFEVSPSVFAKLEEEDLRSVILGFLNAVFVLYVGGSATAESFSKTGKTDIHLQMPRGDILIAECKFWNGIEQYKETIDQLFGYLTWRQNYGILITFSRNTAFTGVLEKIEQATTHHKTYRGQFMRVSETHFESMHLFPEDSKKSVEIHHLSFNLYVPRPD